MARRPTPHDAPGFTPRTLDVKAQLAEADQIFQTRQVGDLTLDVMPGRDTIWILVRRPGHGGVALKTARSAGPGDFSGHETADGGAWRLKSSSGLFDVRLRILSETLVRVTVTLTPAEDLLIPFWSRDLYPLGPYDDPTRAQGRVEASQRGHNTGLCYFSLDKPAFGSVLYVQNLTALNPYFAATKTTPDGVVGGEWPELGYQPPTAPRGNSPPTDPLPKGRPTVISDALIGFRDLYELDEAASAQQFVEMLAEIYPHLGRPEPTSHDWASRAERTVRDLQKSPESVIEHYGHAYIHPYVAAEYPDSMVQMTVLASLREHEAATRKALPFADRLEAGIGRFFDKKLGCMRRYLPNVGNDKDANAVDSWYLYHPLMNLARLAQMGDDKCRRLFLDSIDYAIRAAAHFKYKWPIQFDVRDFSVITASRSPSSLGQTDVGGLYAYVMLQAFDLTGQASFVKEAKASLRALRGVRFELVYQTNLTAWGAVASARLWREEKDPAWLAQAHAFTAGFLHNCELWDSQIGNARHYTNFFGATCLHDAPYMSAYECFESFAAIDELLASGNDDLPAPLRFLLLEYRRYTLDRAWYFYPDALPADAIAKDNIRNGHIDRRLSFPLEDVYGDGQPAGQVGQEIYGCGGAFVFTARSIWRRRGVPFQIFTEYPAAIERRDDGSVAIHLKVLPDMEGRVIVSTRRGGAPLRIAAYRELDGATAPAVKRTASSREYAADASSRLILSWRAARRK
jgi:hypothetical protein